MNSQSGLRTGARMVVLVALGVAVVLASSACGEEVAPAGNVEAGPAHGPALEIVAVDNEFEPSRLHLQPGAEVTVEVTNDGNAPHNFTLEELDLSTGTIEPGEVATATFTAPASAQKFTCTIHPGMEGELDASKSK